MEGQFTYRDWVIYIGFDTIAARGITTTAFAVAIPPARITPPEGKVRLSRLRRRAGEDQPPIRQEQYDQLAREEMFRMIDAVEDGTDASSVTWA